MSLHTVFHVGKKRKSTNKTLKFSVLEVLVDDFHFSSFTPFQQNMALMRL